jgi:membrane-bound lytic murein transglycosylase MltF
VTWEVKSLMLGRHSNLVIDVSRILTIQLFILFLSLGLVACDTDDSESGRRSATEISAQSSERDKPDFITDPEIVPHEIFRGDLPEMRNRRFIRALVVHNQTDFFLENGRIRGIQAEYLSGFEKFLNKGVKKEAQKVRIRKMPVSFDQLIPMVEAGYGDIAAHFLTITPEREQQVNFATGRRQKVNEIVVAHRDVTGIDAVKDLSGREVYVLAGSSYYEHLHAVSKSLVEQGARPVRIREADSRLRSEDILELVNAGLVDLTVVDDYRARLWSQVLPNIRLLEDIRVAEDRNIGWVVRKGSPRLQQALQDYSKQVRKGTKLGNILIARYFSSTRWIADPADQAERDKLNRFLPLFRKYGEKYGFDELALAAQAYQESGLDHSRKSHAGAVGLMQLLPTTVADKNVDIPDISKVEDNIHAGAKYLAFLRDRYFNRDEISPFDRMAFAWAAYNAGPARVRKMRREAEDMGLDPNVWFNNVEVAAGKLVGTEPVRYVANIHKYYVAYRLARDRAQEQQRALLKHTD